jgi:hypothetical protein
LVIGSFSFYTRTLITNFKYFLVNFYCISVDLKISSLPIKTTRLILISNKNFYKNISIKYKIQKNSEFNLICLSFKSSRKHK